MDIDMGIDTDIDINIDRHSHGHRLSVNPLESNDIRTDTRVQGLQSDPVDIENT